MTKKECGNLQRLEYNLTKTTCTNSTSMGKQQAKDRVPCIIQNTTVCACYSLVNAKDSTFYAWAQTLRNKKAFWNGLTKSLFWLFWLPRLLAIFAAGVLEQGRYRYFLCLLMYWKRWKAIEGASQTLCFTVIVVALRVPDSSRLQVIWEYAVTERTYNQKRWKWKWAKTDL